MAGEGERRAARLVFDGQVAEIRTGAVEADVAGIEIVEQQRADVAKTALDQEGLARIAGSLVTSTAPSCQAVTLPKVPMPRS